MSVNDDTGTSPMRRRADLSELAALFARFNAGTRAAALADRDECECGRRFGDHVALVRHRNAAHKPPATYPEPRPDAPPSRRC